MRFRVVRLLELGPLEEDVLRKVLAIPAMELHRHLAMLERAGLIKVTVVSGVKAWGFPAVPQAGGSAVSILEAAAGWENWNPLIERDKRKAMVLSGARSGTR